MGKSRCAEKSKEFIRSLCVTVACTKALDTKGRGLFFFF